ncbi:MAG: trypsin-like serine protease [Cyanobacteria bacterium J06623_4]
MIIRHDIQPDRYLVEQEQFPAVVAVDSFQEEVMVAYDKIDELLKPSLIPQARPAPEFYTRFDGMGMLIQPSWILTAAHVATALSLDKTIEFLEISYALENVVLHPGFQDFGPNDAFAVHDIALIQLKQPVEGVAPLPLYSQTDELEKIVTFVGRGDYGNGLTGPDRVDGALRMATNRIERVDEQWLVFKFDAPPDCTDLEGISGPGDSGGPALLHSEGRWAIAGISSGQEDHGLGEGYYGVTEYYTRVSQYLDWIDSVTSA